MDLLSFLFPFPFFLFFFFFEKLESSQDTTDMLDYDTACSRLLQKREPLGPKERNRGERGKMGLDISTDAALIYKDKSS